MKKTIRNLAFGVVLLSALAGCGTVQNNTSSTTNASMGNMVMGNQASTSTASTSGLTQAFQDELNGFTSIESDIKSGDWSKATTLASNLHDEFHAAILPPLKAKKGNTYAEDIHSKYDALQDAINAKNKTQIAQLIQVNRTNLHTVAQILGITLPTR